jgi:hypothetical protein
MKLVLSVSELNCIKPVIELMTGQQLKGLEVKKWMM